MHISAQRRPACCYRIGDDFTDCGGEPAGAGVRLSGRRRDCACDTAGRQARSPQRLGDIDIAKPRNQPLIEEGGFQRRFSSAQKIAEQPAVKGIAGRLDAQSGKHRVLCDRAVGKEHEAEAPRVVEDHARPVSVRRGKMEYHMVVGLVLGTVVVERAGRGLRRAGFDPERARHSEMADQRRSAVGFDGQELGPAADR